MLLAINKRTGELVDSLRLWEDLDYLNPKEDTWIAPKFSITNLDELKEEEIKVIPVMESSTLNNKCSHFRIPNKIQRGKNKW